MGIQKFQWDWVSHPKSHSFKEVELESRHLQLQNFIPTTPPSYEYNPRTGYTYRGHKSEDTGSASLEELKINSRRGNRRTHMKVNNFKLYYVLLILKD